MATGDYWHQTTHRFTSITRRQQANNVVVSPGHVVGDAGNLLPACHRRHHRRHPLNCALHVPRLPLTSDPYTVINPFHPSGTQARSPWPTARRQASRPSSRLTPGTPTAIAQQ
nr:hypothetical protein CFP56_11146 [Quercus suber]